MTHSGRAAIAPAQLSEARYRGILEQASDAIFVIAPDGAVVVANAGAARMLGYPLDELLGMRIREFVAPEDLAAPEARMSALESGGRLLSERTLIRKDGSRLVAELSTTMLPDASIQGIARDVTARRLAEQRIRDREQRLRAMFEAIPVPTFAWQRLGDDFVMVDFNESARVLTEGRIGRHLGVTARELFSRTPSIASDIARCADTQQIVRAQMEYELVTTGRKRHFAVHFAPVSPDLVLVHTVDNTDRLRAEAELSRREAELRRMHKLDALGRLAGGVAHDFNNLLTVISTGIEFLRERLPEGSEARADAEDIRQAALRATALTRQLLAFGRRQVLDWSPVDLNAILAEIEPLLRRLLGGGIDFRVDLAPTPALVLADVGQVEQVIVNLVVNAHDAMPDGGTLRIGTGAVSIGGDEATTERREGPYALLCVEDSGLGMDECTLRRIFEPFFTTKPDGTGTGLGLSTVHGIVKQTGGFIDVDSRPGQGSSFRVYLPLLRGSAVR